MSESQSHFISICPRCSSKLKVRRIYLGQTVTCKQCHQSFLGVEADGPIATTTGLHTTEPSAQPSQNAERILVVCENCKATLSVRSSRIGQAIRCKNCDREILVRAAHETPPPLVAAVRGSTSLEDLLPLAAGRENPDENDQSLRSQYEQLEVEFEKFRVAHNLLETELARLQPAYSSIEAENKRLSEQVDRLSLDHDALRAKEDWISPIEARAWDEERVSLRAEIEGLRQTLNHQDQNHRSELIHSRADVDQLSEEHRLLRDQLNSAEVACKEHQDRNQELAQAQARLEAELRSQLESERLRHTDLEDQLRLESQNHQSELAHSRADFDQLSEEHRLLRDQRNSAEVACKEHQDHNQELAQAQARLESDFRSQLESERLRHTELEDQLQTLRAELATAAETISGIAESQPARSDQAATDPARNDELEAARGEILILRQRLAELEYTQRHLSTALQGLGIRPHPI